ncbi:MAG: GTPase, partial [Thermoplasmata archaeon]
KKTIIAKVESFSTTIVSKLETYVKDFPNIDELPGFHREILRINIDVDILRRSLGSIYWARKTCEKIFKTQIRSLRRSNNIEFLIKKQKEIYGRISSVVKQVDESLHIVIEANSILNSIPNIEDIPTVVIAGYPNVGKSSLLRMLSKAKPKIASYPFTTTEIHIGHMYVELSRHLSRKIQIIDTPGLLDKPLLERNPIERQAIAALKYLADLIIFLIDPTETCGYPLSNQKNLLSSIKKLFSSDIIVVETKSDIHKTTSKNLKVSCITGEGIDKLRDTVIHRFS